MQKDQALAVISFGTSFRKTREKTIEAIEKDLQEVFPERKFYRAFTSSFIRKKISEKEGERIFSPCEALQKMREDGIRDVLLQPTHLLEGEEFEKLKEEIRPELKGFETVLLGRPLLDSEAHIRAFASVLASLFGFVRREEMAVFMGHGSDSLKLPVYDLLNRCFEEEGLSHFRAGTLGHSPGFQPVLERIEERRPEKVFLSPLLAVAGDHVNKDMAGDDPASWKSRITALGVETECILKGLGEYQEIRALYAERAKNARKI